MSSFVVGAGSSSSGQLLEPLPELVVDDEHLPLALRPRGSPSFVVSSTTTTAASVYSR